MDSHWPGMIRSNCPFSLCQCAFAMAENNEWHMGTESRLRMCIVHGWRRHCCWSNHHNDLYTPVAWLNWEILSNLFEYRQQVIKWPVSLFSYKMILDRASKSGVVLICINSTYYWSCHIHQQACDIRLLWFHGRMQCGAACK